MTEIKQEEKEMIEEKMEESFPITLEKIERKEAEKRKKVILTTERFILLLVFLFSILFLISLYYHANPAAIKPNTPSASPTTETSEPAPTPLPEYLTSLTSETLLVNKNYPLSSDYVPDNLVTPYVNSTSDVIQIRDIAAEPLKELIQAAQKGEINLYITNGYISYETQKDYYEDRVTLIGETEANKVMPKAGYSEHQTGLAVDFTDDPSSNAQVVSFSETKAGVWLKKNAYKYGFILRYPEGKERITGYSFMPWHYRYVGVKTSTSMYSRGEDYTMEEYYEISK